MSFNRFISFVAEEDWINPQVFFITTALIYWNQKFAESVIIPVKQQNFVNREQKPVLKILKRVYMP